MADEEKKKLFDLSANANALAEAGNESMVLALTAAYLAGKEAERNGKRDKMGGD